MKKPQTSKAIAIMIMTGLYLASALKSAKIARPIVKANMIIASIRKIFIVITLFVRIFDCG